MENPALVLTSSNTMKLHQNNGTVPLVWVYDTDDLIARYYIINLYCNDIAIIILIINKNLAKNDIHLRSEGIMLQFVFIFYSC